jgi:NAD(P)-dependent dehydrogenase (short-subunit alcohol dehydrogenase family)
MAPQFADRTIVITGGAGGIGVATARTFLDHGALVVLVDPDAARLTEAAGALAEDRVRTVVSDIATPEACGRIMRDAAPVYALIHLAGLFERDPFVPEEHAIWDRAIAANLTNAYDMAVAFAPCADQRGPARIVLTSSVAYRRGSVGYPPYAAAKAGVVGLTRSLSRRLAPDVLVNAVAPGLIETRMAEPTIAERGDAYKKEIPLQRYGQPQEIASVIRFLCSEDASYLTGQTITVDGGITNA